MENKVWLIGLGVLLIAFFLYRHFSGGSVTPPMEKRGVKVVLFYQNGCPPCESLKPVWNNLVDHFEGQVDFSKVDLANNPVDGVTATPTIWIQKSGKTYQYDGDRTFDSLRGFIAAF